MTSSCSSSRRAGAFTLVEMMIAMVITSLLVAAIIDSVTRAMNFYQTHTSELDRAAAARLTLDVMMRDLSTVVIRDRSDEVWLAAEILDDTSNSGRWMDGGKPSRNSLDLTPAPSKDPGEEPETQEHGVKLPPSKPLPDYRFGQAGVWLRFFSMPEDRDMVKPRTGKIDRQPGNINAMAYQLVRTGTPVGGGVMDKNRIRYQLFRSMVDADLSFEQGYDITAYKGGKASSATKLGSVSTIRSPHPDTAISDQVIDVGFIFHELNDKGERVQSWPVRDSSLPALKSNNVYQVPLDGKPVDVEMYVRVLSRVGAQRLAARERGGLKPEEWWHIANQDSRLFRRAVPLRWSE